ncbi:MAG: hypothetical protein WCN92_07840 [Eubacteriales bacterium]
MAIVIKERRMPCMASLRENAIPPPQAGTHRTLSVHFPLIREVKNDEVL